MMVLLLFVDTEIMRATIFVFFYVCQAVDSVSAEMFNNINTLNV